MWAGHEYQLKTYQVPIDGQWHTVWRRGHLNAMWTEVNMIGPPTVWLVSPFPWPDGRLRAVDVLAAPADVQPEPPAALFLDWPPAGIKVWLRAHQPANATT